MTPLETVLDRLDKVKKSGSGYVALCPSHADREPSLSVSEGTDGRALINCHAGCSNHDVVKALGIDFDALFPPKEKTPRQVVAEYPYTDENGNVLYVVERLVPKSFRQKRPKPGGGYDWKLGDVRRVPFQLPKIIEKVRAGKYVFIVEGEKDALNLTKIGMVGTCNAGGAGKWDASWAGYFADGFVCIVPDNDESGHEHAFEVARTLHGVAKRVKILNLPVPEKGDVTDWLNQGNGAEQLKQLVHSCPDFDPNKRKRPTNLIITRVADVKAERVRWMWNRYLPLGKLVTLEGDPGLGKSTITLDLAARISTGSPMPDGEPLQDSADCLLFTSEDDVGDTIRPRLEAAGADIERIHVVAGIKIEDGQRLIEIPEDIERMEAVIEDYGVRFVIIDPLVAFLGDGIDSHRDQDVRRALFPLSELARRTGACVLLMRHLNKTSAAALYRGGGSIGITGQVRLGMVVANHPDLEDRRVLAVYKSNLARLGDSLMYRIVPADLTGVGKIRWEGFVDFSADDVLLAKPKSKARAALEEE